MTGAGVLCEGSSDPDSGGGHGAAPGRGLVGSNGCLPQRFIVHARGEDCGSELARDCGLDQKPAARSSGVAAKAAPTRIAPDP